MLENKFYLYKAGTGNDFLKDILPSDSQEKLIDITKYLKKLPMVSINGKTTRFINGVGFGIDGMVCAANEQKTCNAAKCARYNKRSYYNLFNINTNIIGGVLTFANYRDFISLFGIFKVDIYGNG